MTGIAWLLLAIVVIFAACCAVARMVASWFHPFDD